MACPSCARPDGKPGGSRSLTDSLARRQPALLLLSTLAPRSLLSWSCELNLVSCFPGQAGLAIGLCVAHPDRP
jgi:hypothetical protein